ncbi:MAG: chromosome segregation protein SMC [Burkholderiales bacterium]
MRLTQIKLAGFKSFVDPTAIATPGQLVGIVGPNGCGKSNVIDAVRWVLGESKASALRGESMQDVIFNGAGDRKPVGRASVELSFDNSQGRIGGQWGQYAELSIKRVLTREGDSTYYINNIPVRRRDIHDLFLGTGLGPRAYAIIEQGMISRVIEAKPEELRIFLEEAAGVSKYRERRKETEGRLADARENLSRVEDIRTELGAQLAKLDAQARVATEYRELETRLKQSQHLLWFAKEQDAVRLRERQSGEIANLTASFEALQADLRAAENRLETLRAEHFKAGDLLHERQGAFYAANAEVTRLEQQLQFARESEGRLSQQVAQIIDQIAAFSAQIGAIAADNEAGEREVEAALARREAAGTEDRAAAAALPALETAVADAARALAEIQQHGNEIEQAIQVAATRRESAAKILGALTQRRERLDAEASELAGPINDQIALVADQLEQESADLAGREAGLAALNEVVQALQERHRAAGDAWQIASSGLAEHEARAQALAALQAKIGSGKDAGAWLAAHGLDHVRRLWQQIDIERGWEDALEGVLRERLNALELPALDAAAGWTVSGVALPGRIAAYAPGHAASRGGASADSLLAKVRSAGPGLDRVLGDWLAGMRCRDDLASALRDRASLAVGEAFVTPAGHVVTAQSIGFFAPDSDLHGVLARQRELSGLEHAIAAARAATVAAAAGREAAESELKARQQEYHGESMALSSQQRRCHDLELELLQLKQAAETAERRRAQIAEELAALADEERAERDAMAAIDAEVAALRGRLGEQTSARDRARHARNEGEVALARGRERGRDAERAAQEAGFAERSCRERIAELDRRRDAIVAQVAQQEALLAQLATERRQIDWTPVEQSLQSQLDARGGAEQALAAARDRLEAIAAELRGADELRLAADQKLEPARTRIEEVRLKEQAAALSEQQYAEQLAEARAERAELPDRLKAWGRPSTLPGEIERLTQAIGGLGAVNLAALDELAQASERKNYLDAQAQDLTEAMATLESAIRQIDRESRALLQQTFDSVNVNFGKLFPTLFGGGQARLLLTGEEILDAGVQVVAQPPGKRNTSIHLLSGGEKSLTAIALVFALFQLNPAPFCLLDEVDAPLDDPNTDRFCALVRTMADVTQFLFISHNKITMEMANQLIGITMADPGVSRVVAVDIAEALELAETVPQ